MDIRRDDLKSVAVNTFADKDDRPMTLSQLHALTELYLDLWEGEDMEVSVWTGEGPFITEDTDYVIATAGASCILPIFGITLRKASRTQ